MFTAACVDVAGSLVVGAPVDQAFELFSPLGEADWVPDWHPELLCPPDAAWAAGQVFRTRSGSNEIIWLVASLDRQAHAVEYHRVEVGRHVAKVRVECSPRAEGGTHVSVRYQFVGLSEAGNQEVARMTPETHAERMREWQSRIERHLSEKTDG
jgi:hypothetical protein